MYKNGKNRRAPGEPYQRYTSQLHPKRECVVDEHEGDARNRHHHNGPVSKIRPEPCHE